MEFTKEQLESLMKAFKDEARPIVDGLIKAATENLLTPDQLTKELAPYADKETVAELTKAIETQGLKMNEFFTPKEEEKTLPQLIADNKEAFAKLKEDPKASVKIVIPAGMLHKTDVTRSSVTDHTLAYRLGGIGQIQSRRLTMESLFPIINVGLGTNGVVRYVDQSSVTRNADEKAEATAYPESAIEWTEKELSLKKITDSIPVSKEALSDVSWINGEINAFIRRNLLLKEDTQLYSGPGTGADIKGVYTYAEEYVAAASGIADANIFDLLLKMRANVQDSTMYAPNVALMNSTDIVNMLVKKDDNNNYVRPDFFMIAPDGTMYLAGMRVVETPVVTADTCLVGDFDYGTIYRMNDIVLEFGYVNDDFIKDLVTLKGMKRENLLVRSVDEGAFNKETGIAAALVTLAS